MIAIWMDRIVDVTNSWLLVLYLATWRTLPILVVVTASVLLFRRRMTPSIKACLWTIVVARLLLPISVVSPLSIHGPLDAWVNTLLGEPSLGVPVQPQSDHPLFFPPVESTADFVRSAEVAYPPPVIPIGEYGIADFLGISMLLVLVSVSVLLLVRSIFSHVRFAVALRKCRLLDDHRFIDLMLHECDSLAVGRRPALREVPLLTAPAVFGLLRPTICVPPGLTEILNENELRWVIRHELAHIRRRDIPVVILASMATALHWFNPIVWVIETRLRAAMEAAADRLALQGLSRNDRSAYGELLLRFAQDTISAERSPTLGLICFASGKHLQKRVELLMHDVKPNVLPTKYLFGAMAGGIALFGLTDSPEARNLQMPVIHLLSDDSTELHVQPLSFDPLSDQEKGGPTFVATYDLSSILKTVPTWPELNEKTPTERLITWIPIPPSIKEKLRIDGETLSAELTASQHQVLKQTLDIWKDGKPGQISIEARVIRTDTETASSIDWAKRRVDGLSVRGLGPAVAARIDEAELASLIRNVSSDHRGSILFAPKVNMFDGQTASISDQVQRPFITGINPKADGRMQPVISVVDEGLSFVLTPKIGDNNSIHLDFRVKVSNIGKVMYANLPLRTSRNEGPQFTVQVPATEQYEFGSSAQFAPGESIVVAIPRLFENRPGADAETTMIVALTPRIVGFKDGRFSATHAQDH